MQGQLTAEQKQELQKIATQLFVHVRNKDETKFLALFERGKKLISIQDKVNSCYFPFFTYFIIYID